MSGADVAALRSLGWALRRRRQEIDATRRRLSGAVEALNWSGADRDRFVEEWRRVHAPSLSSIAEELGDAADRARHHAERQEWASRRR